jgi:hypothetical protein
MLRIARKTSCVKCLGDLVKTRRFTFYAYNTQYDEVSTSEMRKSYNCRKKGAHDGMVAKGVMTNET